MNESTKMLENPGKSVLIRMIFVWTKKKKQSRTHVSIILLAYTIRVRPYLWMRTQLVSTIILM